MPSGCGGRARRIAGERPDLLALYEFADFNLKDKFVPVWARDKDHNGFALGSAGAFLVLESREHASQVPLAEPSRPELQAADHQGEHRDPCREVADPRATRSQLGDRRAHAAAAFNAAQE